MISVRQTAEGDPMRFDVTISEGGSSTQHEVTVAAGEMARLSQGKQTPEALIEASFRFLLDREGKESILRRFDLTIISRYFPDFEGALPRYLG